MFEIVIMILSVISRIVVRLFVGYAGTAIGFHRLVAVVA